MQVFFHLVGRDFINVKVLVEVVIQLYDAVLVLYFLAVLINRQIHQLGKIYNLVEGFFVDVIMVDSNLFFIGLIANRNQKVIEDLWTISLQTQHLEKDGDGR